MASVVKKMECYNIRKSVKDLGEDLKEKIKAERVCDDYKVLGNAFVMLLSFERYYWRNGSYASLTVMLTDDGRCRRRISLVPVVAKDCGILVMEQMQSSQIWQ